MLQLTENEKRIVLQGLELFDGSVLAFGSRVVGTARPDSDLDLCLKFKSGKVPLLILSELRQYFELSSLPFKVDLVDEADLNPDFMKSIQALNQRLK